MRIRGRSSWPAGTSKAWRAAEPGISRAFSNATFPGHHRVGELLMSEKVEIIDDELNIEEVISKVRGPATGAIITFLGTVRADPGITHLEIEDYREMTLKLLRDIRQRALEGFDINDVAIVHRVGYLDIGEDIVGIAVAAAHRAQAFDACRFVIEEIKAKTPIWKMDCSGP
jgi:molybdopterin synthase catalytic subunit